MRDPAGTIGVTGSGIATRRSTLATAAGKLRTKNNSHSWRLGITLSRGKDSVAFVGRQSISGSIGSQRVWLVLAGSAGPAGKSLGDFEILFEYVTV